MLRSFYYIKRIIFTVFVVTFLLAFGAAITSVYTLERYESLSVEKISSSVSESSTSEISQATGYLIKEFEGVIGVFEKTDKLMYKVDVYVKTLPARDRELLKNGIFAESYGEVLEILGDYTA